MTDEHKFLTKCYESPLFSFSSRSGSPTIPNKPQNLPFEFTENTRPGSFISFNTPATRFSSISVLNEPYKSLNDSTRYDKMLTTGEGFNMSIMKRQLALDIPEIKRNKLDFENGIPTLKWCAFCKCETATEVFYLNSEKTFWASVAIFLSGGVFGCFLLPYAMDSCKAIKTRCHRCKHIIEEDE